MRTGPVLQESWARIWARAYCDIAFRRKLENSPREAVISYFGKDYQPLFELTGNMAHQCVKDIYNALNQIAGNLQRRGEVEDLRDRKTPYSTDVDNIIQMVHGNTWEVRLKGRSGNPYVDHEHQLGVSSALSQEDWARVYAKAVLDSSFLGQLQSDPRAAIVQFHNAHNIPGWNPATSPLLKLNSAQQLLSHTNHRPDLDTEEELLEALEDIDKGNSVTFDAILKICLTC